jgi:hypothetical protein
MVLWEGLGIRVNDTDIQHGSGSIAVRQIVSVELDADSRWTPGNLAVIALAFIFLFGGVFILLLAREVTLCPIACIGTSAFMLIASAFFLIPRPHASVWLTTPAGRMQLVRSRDHESVTAAANAIRHAMSARGF